MGKMESKKICLWCGKSIDTKTKWQTFCQPDHKRAYEKLVRKIGQTVVQMYPCFPGSPNAERE